MAYRSNDGLDPTSTTDARGGRDQGYGGSGMRGNDGLDPSSTTDAYDGQSRGYGGSGTRGNDGLDPSGTSDAYGDVGGRGGGSSNRRTDGLDASGTSDAYGDTGTRSHRAGIGGDRASKLDRSAGGNYDDPSYSERTSGGLGSDDTYGTSERTGGVNRGGDQETSRYTSGGLGENDTYGNETQTGGVDTGRDGNYGMGSGRTKHQEQGGLLPSESGRDMRGDDDYQGGEGPRSDSSNKNKDSSSGKLMEKAGSMFGSGKLQQKGEQKRREAGGYDNTDDY